MSTLQDVKQFCRKGLEELKGCGAEESVLEEFRNRLEALSRLMVQELGVEAGESGKIKSEVELTHHVAELYREIKRWFGRQVKTGQETPEPEKEPEQRRDQLPEAPVS